MTISSVALIVTLMAAALALGCTSIVVTHDMDSAFRVSDRMAMLAKRHIVASGTVEAMQASQDPDVRAFFDARSN